MAAKSRDAVKPNNIRYEIDGKDVFVLGEGRLVNLAAAEGHSPEVMIGSKT